MLPAWAALAFSACAPLMPPKQTVYIPPEYLESLPPREAPPREAEAPKPPPEEKAVVEEPPSAEPYESAILQPRENIQERDLAPAPEVREPVYEREEGIETVEEAAGGVEEGPVEPQQVASMHLVDQADAFLEQGNVDQAISTLEQSIQVDVYNGDAFYGLARAWRMKGDFEKSLEFASKAEVLYKDRPARLKELYLFQADVHMVLNEYEKAEVFRKKANAL